MSRLETRYRALLRLLPGWYRSQREAEMVATFLEGTQEIDLEYAWPGWSETARVVALAVRLRLCAPDAPARSLAWRQAARLVAVLGLLANAILALLGWGWLAWAAVADHSRTGSDTNRYVQTLLAPATVGELQNTVLFVLHSATVPAFLCLVLGRRQAAKIFAGTTVVGSLYQIGQSWALGVGTLLGGVEVLMLWVPVLCLVCAFHREAPRVQHPRRWLAALPAGALLGSGALVVAPLALPDAVSLYCVAVVASTVWYLIRARFHAMGTSPAWLLALAALGAVVLIVRAVDVAAFRAALPTVVLDSYYAQIGALLVTGVVLTIMAIRSVRQLPATPAASAGGDGDVLDL